MNETLECASSGKPLRVIDIQGGRDVRARLATMGVIPGAMLEVLMRGPLGGPIVVEVNGARLAIGRGMARNVFVAP